MSRTTPASTPGGRRTTPKQRSNAEDGKGVEKDALKAYAWYRCSANNARRKKSADKSDIEAGIEQDALKSLQLLESRLSADELRRAGGLAEDYIRRYGTAAPL